MCGSAAPMTIFSLREIWRSRDKFFFGGINPGVGKAHTIIVLSKSKKIKRVATL